MLEATLNDAEKSERGQKWGGVGVKGLYKNTANTQPKGFSLFLCVCAQ